MATMTATDNAENGMDSGYSLPSLDSDWFPVVKDRLRRGGGAVAKSFDETDFSAKRLLKTRSRAEAMDDIDGRGTFDRREMEDELRSMHREELEDQLGTSLLMAFCRY